MKYAVRVRRPLLFPTCIPELDPCIAAAASSAAVVSVSVMIGTASAHAHTHTFFQTNASLFVVPREELVVEEPLPLCAHVALGGGQHLGFVHRRA